MLTQADLHFILNYDQDTGIFTWKNPLSTGVKSGEMAGNFNSYGYIRISINKQRYYAHRLAWFYVNGVWPKKYIDHINNNRSDNRFCNLREANEGQNQKNAKMRSDNTSGIKNVSWCNKNNKWVAYIMFDKKRKTLGYFDDIKLAESVVKAARVKLHGDFYNHG